MNTFEISSQNVERDSSWKSYWKSVRNLTKSFEYQLVDKDSHIGT